MIPEIGHLALVMALVTSICLTVLALYGRAVANPTLMYFARPATLVTTFLLLVAYLILTWSFVVHDFSVLYVAQNSNYQLPLLYRLSGVWGAHEGSILLWIVCLSGWASVFAWRSRHLPPTQSAAILGIMSLVLLGFLLFSILTSNPFVRQLPPPSNGADLNPLLQDPGMAIHPPMLYLGYVGFAIAFAFAIAALIEGKLDASWARNLKPWVNSAWAFLTVGIALGSWWAYYELGWGGWWFWDPVENASFMPWLIATALLHSLTATEQRGVFKAWTLLLAILAFALSLLGTFLVRSGILTSVHAFSNDPERGLFILVLLALTIGSAFVCYSWRAHLFTVQSGFRLASREAALLVNNVFLVVITATILLGTLYPLLAEALGWGKISVGEPYFNRVVVPLAVPLFVLIGVGSFLLWQRNDMAQHLRILAPSAAVAVLAGALVPVLVGSGYDWRVGVGSAVALWIVLSLAAGLRAMLKKNTGSKRVPLSVASMIAGHLGVAFFCIGVAFSSGNSQELVRAVAPGDSVEISGYTIEYQGFEQKQVSNYEATIAKFVVSKDGQMVTTMFPEKRMYPSPNNIMTEAAIYPTITHDLFIALGEQINDEAWSVRIQYKSFIRWIWFGALIMALGALCENLSVRYRQGKKTDRRARLEATPTRASSLLPDA